MKRNLLCQLYSIASCFSWRNKRTTEMALSKRGLHWAKANDCFCYPVAKATGNSRRVLYQSFETLTKRLKVYFKIQPTFKTSILLSFGLRI